MKKLLILFLLSIIFISCKNSDSSKIDTESQEPSIENSSYSNQSESQDSFNDEPKQVECYTCKGKGIITCTMCDGTGTNNMGAECGCVTYVNNMIAMGKTPDRTALQWTCEDCEGTGVKNK